MGDILKEAIADAKAVRETALANAKMALEEAFTPQLKSMLSAKLKEDEFGDDEEEIGGEEELGDEEGGEDFAAEEDDEFGGEDEFSAEEPEIAPEEDEEFGGEDEFDAEEPEVDESKIIEIDGVQYAPVVSEEDEDFGDEEEVDIEDDNLDLESIIRELEDEINEEDDAYDENADSTDSSHLAEEDDAYDEDVEGDEQPEHVGGNIGESTIFEIDESLFEQDEEDDDDEEIEEQSDSSNIGSGDNAVNSADASDEEDPGNSTDVESLGEELREYKKAVHFLKNKLHEVNILNAKLLFTNKLFKEFALDNNQKLKVVETFDRAQSTREIKLVYSTLAEQFGDNGSISKRNPIKESASSKSGSTKPSKSSRKVITEESQVANRFKKLAGIING
jgi:hypothetical protein